MGFLSATSHASLFTSIIEHAKLFTWGLHGIPFSYILRITAHRPQRVQCCSHWTARDSFPLHPTHHCSLSYSMLSCSRGIPFSCIIRITVRYHRACKAVHSGLNAIPFSYIVCAKLFKLGQTRFFLGSRDSHTVPLGRTPGTQQVAGQGPVRAPLHSQRRPTAWSSRPVTLIHCPGWHAPRTLQLLHSVTESHLHPLFYASTYWPRRRLHLWTGEDLSWAHIQLKMLVRKGVLFIC